MYHSQVSFESPLSPRDYFADDVCAREMESVFEATWQLAGLKSSVAKSGQYLSLEIGREPVLIRNFEGQLVAMRNVCTHRHCTLVSAVQGQSDKLKCPYHGWEFGSDGRTRKIPAAKNFPDFDREQYRIQQFALETCGDLIFIRIAAEGPSLREWLGDLFAKFESWTSMPDWGVVVRRNLPAPANWKIPVDVSLESYHIPEVHPNSFGEDPGEQKSEHAFAKYSTSFFTAFNTPRFIDKLLKVYEQFILWLLGIPFIGRYEHHHVFPNLMISRTDSLVLVQVVRPLSSQSCASDVWQFGVRSARRNPISKLTAWYWGKFLAFVSKQILNEDLRILPQVQKGEQAAARKAILGRCEERLFAYHAFVSEQMKQRSEKGSGSNSAQHPSGTSAIGS